jgi:hypothetical protein
VSAVIDDRRAASPRFVELILADPDLLDVAFAAVEASWSAAPPARRPTIAIRARRASGREPLGRHRQPSRPRRNRPAHPTWPYRTARSPPLPADPVDAVDRVASLLTSVPSTPAGEMPGVLEERGKL